MMWSGNEVCPCESNPTRPSCRVSDSKAGYQGLEKERVKEWRRGERKGANKAAGPRSRKKKAQNHRAMMINPANLDG